MQRTLHRPVQRHTRPSVQALGAEYRAALSDLLDLVAGMQEGEGEAVAIRDARVRVMKARGGLLRAVGFNVRIYRRMVR